MPRFFIDSVDGDTAEITGGDARHIALSLRMKIGEEIVVCDGNGNEALGKIATASPESVVLSLFEHRASKAEPKTEVILYQALPKFDKLEYIVQKSVELGVSKIVPVLTSRCISRPDEKSMSKKIERLQKISDEAAMQSGRGKLPKIAGLMTYKNAVKEFCNSEMPIFLYERADFPLRSCMEKYGGGRVSLFVGAEGGFSEEEAEFAKQNGARITSLGPRILRCETAPIAAISAIMYARGEMEIL